MIRSGRLARGLGFPLCGLLVVACGAAAGEGGGDSNLPTRAAGPYGKLDPDPDTAVDEPVLLSDPEGRADWRAPWLRHADGDAERYLVFFTEADGAGSRIQRADDVDLADGPGDLTLVLEASEAWEGTRVADPTVIEPGLTQPWGLLYGAGEGAIGYAGSEDGYVFDKDPGNPILEATLPEEGQRVGQPASVWNGDTLWVYYAAPDVGAIFAAVVRYENGIVVEKVDADPSTPEHDPVLGPSPFSVDFDTAAVGAPFVRVTHLAGRAVFDLWYAGHAGDGEWTVGFAGSHDGLLYKRFDENPVLPSGGVTENDPAVVTLAVGGLMLFTEQKAGHPAVISAAIH